MLFWILAAALTAVVLLIIVPPLLKAPRAEAAGPSRGAYDLEVYRDQLAELERDRARGLITDAQMEAAKAEIARRMLALADEAKKAAPRAAASRTRAVAVLLAVALPLGAVVVYLPLGRPDLPAVPLASRDIAAEERQMAGPPPQVMEAMQKLKKHLEDNPNDAQAWTLMGQTYGKIGRFDQAAEALKRAADLQPGSLDAKAAYAEMATASNGGTVTEESLRIFQAMLVKDPKDARARFFLALAKMQAGDAKGALDGWTALVADTPADAPWLPVVQARIKEAATILKLDVASVMPKPAPPQQGHPDVGGQGSGTADQDQQIRQMVAQLDAKMRANPEDVDGWLKLARSYSVLGDHDKAIDAAKQALDRAPKRVDVRVSYADALLGRAPEDGPMPADAVAALREVLALDPANREALWLLGLDAAQGGRRDEAAELWNRLLAQMDPKDPDRETVRQRLASLKGG
ncbi:MAG TPA: c-type cytochrome biogenesis protein CcmI [Azospirillum sp.]|nr:c-type cytochrome biogenesis protein CcmI [Azospirillum sp.]